MGAAELLLPIRTLFGKPEASALVRQTIEGIAAVFTSQGFSFEHISVYEAPMPKDEGWALTGLVQLTEPVSSTRIVIRDMSFITAEGLSQAGRPDVRCFVKWKLGRVLSVEHKAGDPAETEALNTLSHVCYQSKGGTSKFCEDVVPLVIECFPDVMASSDQYLAMVSRQCREMIADLVP